MIAARHRVRLGLVLALLAVSVSPRSMWAQDSCTFFSEDVVVREGETRDCDLKVVHGDLEVEAGGVVDGDVIVALGGVRVEGRVRGDLNVWRDARIDGRVDGDVYAMGDLELTARARIGGDVAAVGAVAVDPEAQVGEIRSARELRPDPRAVSSGARIRDLLQRLLWGGGLVALAALFGALAAASAPRGVLNLRAAAGSRPWGVLKALAAGLLTFALLLPAIPGLSIVTGIGGLSLLLALLIAIAMGSVGIGQKLGARLGPGAEVRVQTALGSGAVALVLALLLYGPNLALVCGGLLLTSLFFAWAAGAAVLSRFGTRGPLDVQAHGHQPHASSSSGPDAPGTWGEPETEAVDFSPVGRAGGAGASPSEAAEPAGAPAAPASHGLPGARFDAMPEPPAARPISADDADGTVEDSAADVPPQHADLEQVQGITPIYAALLREGGVSGLAQLAAAEPAALVKLVAAPGVLPITRATAEAWVAEASEWTPS